MATTRQLEALRIVGETGSLTNAAKELGISPAAVFRRIEKLSSESEQTLTVGIQGGGTTLTPAGKVLVDKAKRLLV